MSEPDLPAAAGQFPDDGIPVLTEVVDAALLPEIDPGSLEPTDEDSAEGPPSLAMFPELETVRGLGPAHQSSPISLVASLTGASVAVPLATPAEPPPRELTEPPPGELAVPPPYDLTEPPPYELTEPPPHELAVPPPHELVVPPPLELAEPPPGDPAEPPLDTQRAPLADTIAEVPAAHALAPEASNAALFQASPEPLPDTHQVASVNSGSEPQALPQRMQQHEASYAERYAARYAALQKLPPVDLGTAFEPQPQPMQAVAGPAAQTAQAAGEGSASEAPSEIETRIFESIAARVDRLLDQRLEAIVPGVVEAALYGIQAGMTASVRQALREAVEQAVRHEFERRREP